jgi:beta-glucosidase
VLALTSRAGMPIRLVPAGNAAGHGDRAVVRADLARAAALGINAYRFSTEWARVEPRRGAIDHAALAYYDGVADDCAAAGLTPIVTLNHFTLPAWVLTPPRARMRPGLPLAAEDEGFRASLRGWESEETVSAFVAFARLMVATLGPRVKHWLTLNEPAGAVALGYLAGIWPPGFVLAAARARRALLNLIRAHVRCYEAIKDLDPFAQVSFGQAVLDVRAASGRRLVPARVERAAAAQFEYFHNRHFLEAVVNGRVDVAIQRSPGRRRVLESDAAMRLLGLSPRRPWTPKVDFVAVNYHRSVTVGFHPLVTLAARYAGGIFPNDERRARGPHGLVSDLGWELAPAGLGDALRRLHARYGVPLLVTENGVAESSDRNRAPALVAHVAEMLKAMRDGVDVRGYFHWTLIDNYEWHEGYRPAARFGLYRVDRSASSRPRELTEAALALRCIVTERSPDEAAWRFGTIGPRRAGVVAPVRSAGCIWEGRGGAAKFALLVTSSTLGRLDGMLFAGDPPSWLALDEVAWEARSRSLRFSHRSLSGGSCRARVDGDWLVATDGLWQAERLRPFGLWTSGAPLGRFVLARAIAASEAWAGKALEGGPPASWHSIESVEWDGHTLRLRHAGSTLTGVIEGDAIHGEVHAAGPDSASVWQARRAPAGLPF